MLLIGGRRYFGRAANSAEGKQQPDGKKSRKMSKFCHEPYIDAGDYLLTAPKERRRKSIQILLQYGFIEEHFPGQKPRTGNRRGPRRRKPCPNSQNLAASPLAATRLASECLVDGVRGRLVGAGRCALFRGPRAAMGTPARVARALDSLKGVAVMSPQPSQ